MDVVHRAPIEVGIRLPLATKSLPPDQLLQLCRTALDLGYRSFWVGDHVLLPAHSASAYPHTEDGHRPFTAQTPWADPFLTLTWLAAQLPSDARFGTSIIIVTLRNAALLAKQLSTMSWLTRRGFSLGVGTGWLREEYDAVGATFEGRATIARQQIAEIRELLGRGQRDYLVRAENPDDGLVSKPFTMLPRAHGDVDFLWGGFSPVAMRMIAACCDGWLPAKQSIDQLGSHIKRLRAACEEAGREFEDLRLVVKPGSGPDPASGAINAENLEHYAALGFSEAILEMPFEPANLGEATHTIELVAKRSGLC